MTTRPILRGVIHCHSRFSYDSLIRISSYLRVARLRALDFVVLTDHDSIAGSIELRRRAARELPDLQVPIAAEYCTDLGDVIALGISREIGSRDFAAFEAETRSQGALLLLPHPYVSHREIEHLASRCDIIETYNPRVRDQDNRRAVELARRLGKPAYAGSDAHLRRSLGNVIVEIENRGSLAASLSSDTVRWTSEVPTPGWEIHTSQLIKACKKRELRPAVAAFRAALRFLHRRV